MTLSELYAKPLAEALSGLVLVDLKVHTDPNSGKVRCVELKYRAEDTEPESEILTRGGRFA